MTMLRLASVVASCALALTLSVGRAGSATYAVNGAFSNGATLSGSINVDNGTLFSVGLNGGNALPGDAVIWSGTAICPQPSCAPNLVSYFYILGSRTISESYTAATQTYDFHFNGGGTSSSLDLLFTLQGTGGVILGGKAFDPLCSPFCPFEPFSTDLTGGSLVLTPLPPSQGLFLAGLGIMGLLHWFRAFRPNPVG